LEKVQKSKRKVLVEEADKWTFKNAEACLCSTEKGFELLPRCEIHQRFIDLVERVLQPYLPASTLVELGAGYGSVILSLAKKKSFRYLKLIAAEYTSSGVKLIQRLAKNQHSEIKTGHCDFGSVGVTDLDIPADAVIFTSFATPCVPNLPASFVASLAGFRPRVVAHFEPCYEHCDRNTLLGLMRRRYIEINDYNRNLVTLLHKKQAEGDITILKECPAVMGPNPLLSASILHWKPNCK